MRTMRRKLAPSIYYNMPIHHIPDKNLMTIMSRLIKSCHLSFVEESGTEIATACVPLRVYSDSLRFKVVELVVERVGGIGGYLNEVAAVEAIIASSINTVGQMERGDSRVGSKVQSQRLDTPLGAELQSGEAEILGGAGSLGIEEVSLVDVDLVIDPVNEVRIDGLLQVLQGFEVGDLFEAEGVVVEELDPRCRPALELGDANPDGFGVDASEVDGGHVGRH